MAEEQLVKNITGGGRIEFVDLAKGVCILLVVLYHVGIEIPHFDVIRMPLYFIISGLFFKSYGSVKSFVLKKTNKILVPFIAFYLLSYCIFYIIKVFDKNLNLLDNGILDVFVSHHIFNTPIWFLLCLFWVSIIFCILYNWISNEYLLGIVILGIGIAGSILKHFSIYLPLFLDSSVSALPFYYVGYLLKKSKILLPNKYDKYCLILSALLFIITFYLVSITGIHLDIQYNIVPILSYLVSPLGVLAVLLLCKQIKRVPLVSYFGRYSIIILVTHNLVYSFVKVGLAKLGLVINGIEWVQFFIVILASLVIIPLFIKYIPKLVAQEDLIKA